MADVLRQRERQAQALYGAGRYQDAISVADEVYAQDACREHNLLLLGAAHFQLRQLPESCFFSQQALRIDPQNAEAFSNLGNALKELGDVRGSVAFFLKAIKCSPRFAAAYNNLAAAHTQLGESQSAKEAYEMALVLDPALVEAHCNLGNLHKAKGQGALARKCYMEAIRLQPGAAIAWSNLAGLFKDEGQVATSVAYYREALRLAPSCADFYSNLGAALQDQRNLGEARTCFETALELRSDYAVARGNLGACLLAQGEYAGAVKSLRQALQLEPNFPDAFNNLGSALSALAKGDDPGTRQQHLDESVASYRACLRLQPDHPHAYSNLGVALQKRGMVREAVHCFVSAARLMPSFAPAHANLASLLREQGAMDQALAHYHQSIALDPSFAAAYSALGDAYRELRQPDDALDCYATALKIDPKSAAALTAQGAALLDKSDFPAAAAAFRSALAVDGNASEGAALAGLLRASDASCSWEGRWALLERLSVVLEKELQNDGFDDHLMDAKILQRTNESAQTRALAAPNAPAQLGDVPPFFGPLPSAQPFDCLALTQIVSPRDAQRVARRFAARAKASLALAGDAAEKHKAFSLKGPLRVGYISANFGNTPTGFLLCPAVPLHSNAIQATCYALQPPDGSDARHELERKVPGGVVDVSSLTARQVAQAISRDGIQVLVHCDGHGDGSRLEILALRPAPIQVTLACGFAGTLGADYVDYVVVDDVVAISGEGLDEARMTLSTCVINGRSLKFHNAPTCTRHDLGLPDDAFVFAFFGPSLLRRGLGKLLGKRTRDLVVGDLVRGAPGTLS